MSHVPRLDLSPAFIQAIVTMHGATGRAWLAGLPATLAACAAQWDIQIDPPFAHLTYHFVAPGARRSDGQPVVVKICAPTGEFALEAAALRHFAGRGMAQLLAEDSAREALLLERLVPGTPLRLMADATQATHIAADVMRALWRPPPATPAFPSVADWHQGFARLHAHYPDGTGPFPPALVAEAEDLYAWLMATAGPPVLLHGDLHHDNILAAQRMPYLAIDPKGLVGEAAYEVGSWLRNWLPDLLAQPHPGQILARRVDQFAEELGFARARVRGWAVYQAVLSAWADVEDFGQPSAAMLTCAELLAAIPA
jgi:streptomycin 6-kinase